VPSDHRRMHDQTGRDVSVENQDRIGRKETLRQDEAANGGVVEGALQPLGRGRLAGCRGQRYEKTGQRAEALGPHRILLVGHRRRADLVGFKRFLDLTLVRQQAQIGAEAVRTLSNPPE